MSTPIQWSKYFTFKPGSHLSSGDITSLVQLVREFAPWTDILPATLTECYHALQRLPIEINEYSGRIVWRKEKGSLPIFNQLGGRLERMIHGLNAAYGSAGVAVDEDGDVVGLGKNPEIIEEGFSFEDLVDLAEGRAPKPIYDKSKPAKSKAEQIEELRVRYNEIVNPLNRTEFLQAIVDSKTRIERIKDPRRRRS